MKTATTATNNVATAVKDSMTVANRPWLMITGIDQKWIADRNGGLHFEVAIKNIGHSPATHIRLDAKILAMRDPTENEIKAAIPELIRKKPVSGRTLVPTDSDKLDGYIPETMTATTDRQDLAYLLCCVSYSFTFNAENRSGCYVGGYRIFENPAPEERTLRVGLDVRYVKYYSHAY